MFLASLEVLLVQTTLTHFLPRSVQEKLQTIEESAKAKKSNKENSLPHWLRQGQDEPMLKHEDVKKHLKKIEFYLSWSKANHQTEFSEYF